MSDDPRTDGELMALVALGDDAAFSAVYLRHARVVRLVAYRGLGDAGAADDIVQEVFVDAWRKATVFEPARGSLSTWLRTIASRRVIDAHRRAAARPRMSAVETEPQVPDGTAAVLDRLVVADALKELSQEQRDLLRMAFWGDLTYSEIGERMCVPLGTVKSRARSSMARLARAMTPA